MEDEVPRPRAGRACQAGTIVVGEAACRGIEAHLPNDAAAEAGREREAVARIDLDRVRVLVGGNDLLRRAATPSRRSG